jgi:hypothetical protein
MSKTRLNFICKQAKYHNEKCIYKDMQFDSLKERNHYIVLEHLEKTGQIKDLKRQVKFELQPSFKLNGKTIRAINYIADFTYLKDGILVVVDTKGFRTKDYLLKKKMFQYKYGMDIVEV